MATTTFAQLDVTSFNPLTRYDASGATHYSQWTTGLKTTAATGAYVICNDDTLSTPLMTLDGSGNLTVNGTFSSGGGINVSLSNPIISGLITSVGTTNMTVNDADLNLSAMYGRKVDGTMNIVDNGDNTYTINLDSSIDGNTTTGIYTSGLYINIQNPGVSSPFDNNVYPIASVTTSSITFTAGSIGLTPTTDTNAYLFLVNPRSSLNGAGMYLRAGDAGGNSDVTMIYNQSINALQTNVDLFNAQSTFNVVGGNDLALSASGGAMTATGATDATVTATAGTATLAATAGEAVVVAGTTSFLHIANDGAINLTSNTTTNLTSTGATTMAGQSVTIDASGADLTLSASGNVTSTAGVGIAMSASGGNLALTSASGTTIASQFVVMDASSGNIALTSASGVVIASTFVSANASNGNMTLTSASGVVVAGQTVTMDASGGDLTLRSDASGVVITAAQDVTVDALGGNLTLQSDNSGVIMAGQSVTINASGTDLVMSASGNVSLTAVNGTATLAATAGVAYVQAGTSEISIAHNGLIALNSATAVNVNAGSDIHLSAGSYIESTATTTNTLTGQSVAINASGSDITMGASGNVIMNAGLAVEMTSSGSNITLTSASGTIIASQGITMDASSGNIAMTSASGVTMTSQFVTTNAGGNTSITNISGTIFNTTNTDATFQVEGLTNPNLFYINNTYTGSGSGVATVLTSITDWSGGVGGLETPGTVYFTYSGFYLLNPAQIIAIVAQDTNAVSYSGGDYTVAGYSPTTGLWTATSPTATAVHDDNALLDTTATHTLTPTGEVTYYSQSVGIGKVPDMSGTYILDINGATRGVSYTSTSDRVFKKNIESITSDEALSIVSKVNPVRYNWKTEEYPQRNFTQERDIGFIAQELQALVPELVKGSEGNMAVDYAKMVAVLAGAVQALSAKVTYLEGIITGVSPCSASTTASYSVQGLGCDSPSPSTQSSPVSVTQPSPAPVVVASPAPVVVASPAPVVVASPAPVVVAPVSVTQPSPAPVVVASPPVVVASPPVVVASPPVVVAPINVTQPSPAPVVVASPAPVVVASPPVQVVTNTTVTTSPPASQ